MVAIVVVLATAVSGAGFGVVGGIASPAPQTNFEFTPDDVTGDVIVTKVAGNSVSGDQLKFFGAAREKTTYGSITEWAGNDVRAGGSASVDVRPGETLKLVWQSPNGRTEAILAEYDVPDDVGPTASIGSVTANDGENKIIVNGIQFNKVTDESVYVVVEKRPRSNAVTGSTSTESEFSTNGGGLVTEELGANRPGNWIRVTVYETSDKSTELATQTFTVGGRGGIVRGGR